MRKRFFLAAMQGTFAQVDRDRHPAFEAAGPEPLVLYAMRHTFASFAIAAGVSLFYLARLMGSSVEQIDRTYGHMLSDSEDYLRGVLDTFGSGTVVPLAISQDHQ